MKKLVRPPLFLTFCHRYNNPESAYPPQNITFFRKNLLLSVFLFIFAAQKAQGGITALLRL